MRHLLVFLIVCAGTAFPIGLVITQRPEIETRPPMRSNPVTYVFHGTVHETELAIHRSFERFRWRGLMLSVDDPALWVSPSDGMCSPYARLESCDRPMGKSRITLVSGSPADYIASFGLWIRPVGDHETRITVETRAAVRAGKKFEFGSTGPGFYDRLVPVESSTIEEYEILIRIGAELGEKDMPALVLP